MQKTISLLCTGCATPKFRSFVIVAINDGFSNNDLHRFSWIKKWGKIRAFDWSFVTYHIIDRFSPQLISMKAIDYVAKMFQNDFWVLRKLRIRKNVRWRFLGVISVQIIPTCSWETCRVLEKKKHFSSFPALNFDNENHKWRTFFLPYSSEISYFGLFWTYFAQQVNYTYIMCTVLTKRRRSIFFFLQSTPLPGWFRFYQTQTKI